MQRRRSAAALATAFGGDYLSEFVELPTVLVALGVIAVVSAINFRGIKESANFNLGCTLIELGGLFLVVADRRRVPVRRRRRPAARSSSRTTRTPRC